VYGLPASGTGFEVGPPEPEVVVLTGRVLVEDGGVEDPGLRASSGLSIEGAEK